MSTYECIGAPLSRTYLEHRLVADFTEFRPLRGDHVTMTRRSSPRLRSVRDVSMMAEADTSRCQAVRSDG